MPESQVTKKRVIFVDDEHNVLNGLKRMLHSMQDKWEMHFAISGQKALEIMAVMPFDVVVSDMRMPGMDGAQLLTEIMRRYPQTVRIILSGNSEREMILKSVGPTHQYLAKPCDPKKLINVIMRACVLQEFLQANSLKSLVSQMKSLPSVPALYQEIIKELRSPKSSTNKIGEIISQDMSMTTKVLQLVNSAFFGLPRHVSSPAQAVKLLGLDTIRALVLQVSIFSKLETTKREILELNILLRKHSLATGFLAKAIAKDVTKDEKAIDDSFLAGLIHDIGMVVLANEAPDKYEETLKLSKERNISIFHAEKSIFNATHANVGGYLLGLWGFPQLIVEAVLFHHEPSKCEIDEFSPLTAVHVANVWESKLSRGIENNQLDTMHISTIKMTSRLHKWENICSEVLEKIKSYE